MMDKCARCGGTDMMQNALSAHDGVVIGREFKGEFEWVLVRCSICLGCGAVFPYVDEMAIAQLRTWREAQPALRPGAPAAQTAERTAAAARWAADDITVDGAGMDPAPPPPSGGANFNMVLIIGALIGVLFAVIAIASDMMK